MRRTGVTLALVATGALGVAGFAAAGAGAHGTARAARPVKLTIWVGWSQRELSVFKKVVAEYDQKHPEVTVSVVGGINDNKIVAAIRGGNAPDIGRRSTPTTSARTAASGAWVDLEPAAQAGRHRPESFPAATRYYTEYGGKRCALPMLADTYGLYYNKKLFKAGHHRPAEDDLELTADAKKLTKRDSGGTHQGRRVRPVRRAATRTCPSAGAARTARKWLDSRDKSNISSDPAWSKLLKWQKSAHRLVRLRQARSSSRPAWATSSPPARRSRRKARDEHGRRVAGGVHRRRASRARLRHRADAGRRRPSRAVRRGLHERQRSSACRKVARTRSRRGSWSST